MKSKILLIVMCSLFSMSTATFAQRHRSRAVVIRAVPPGARVVPFRGVNYHFVNGSYYQPIRGGYRVVPAPAGIQINVIPPGYRLRVFRGGRYFYRGNIFYHEVRPNVYVVTRRPW